MYRSIRQICAAAHSRSGDRLVYLLRLGELVARHRDSVITQEVQFGAVCSCYPSEAFDEWGECEMAQYLWIQQFGARDHADATRANFQATLDYFVTWTPPDGVAMLHLWMALDLGRAFSLWEADDPMKMAIAAANFLPFGEIETIPVGEGEAMIAAMVTGGLMRFPDPASSAG
jgi:hypothetical protein